MIAKQKATPLYTRRGERCELFAVNIGYTRKGRPRNRYFASMDGARRYCARVFDTSRVILSIVAVQSGPRARVFP